MKRKELFAPSGVELEFTGGLSEVVTGHAGIVVLVEVMRASGVLAVAERVLPAKKNPKGLSQGQMVESVVVHAALGAECMDDMQVLRRDLGLAAILGHEMPAPSTLRSWLEQFHDETTVAGRPRQGSFIPQESSRLAGLAALVAQSVRSYVAAGPVPRQVTLDVDAHLVESTKREALLTYEGYRGFQPLVVVWAETGLIMADQFRDGNVPASVGIADLVDAAYATLPARSDGWEVRVRSDTAAYEEKNLAHPGLVARTGWSALGWKFAVGADMSIQLRQAVENLKIEDWREWQVEPDGFVREWAEVDFVPGRKAERRDGQPYRYLAIRIRSPQGRLFSDGVGVKMFAVVTNDWETPGRQLLEWQRGKAGTVENAHRVLKDELAAGVYPSAKFGANAAWLRLQVLTSNLLILMAAVGLDEEYRHARPKRLRFAIFNHVGTMVSRAGQMVMQVINRVLEEVIGPGLRRLRRPTWQAV